MGRIIPLFDIRVAMYVLNFEEILLQGYCWNELNFIESIHEEVREFINRYRKSQSLILTSKSERKKAVQGLFN